MKKIENIIDSCNACRYCKPFEHGQDGLGTTAVICLRKKQLIGFVAGRNRVDIPDWCPLETYKEAEESEAQQDAAAVNPSTIILPGLPHLEWMTENLSGFGGTEIDGNTYYTYDEAEEAVKQLGDGWRLPTRGEMVDLDDQGSTWQDEGPHGLPGRLFGGGLFLEAAGLRSSETGALEGVGAGGYWWSSSSYAAGSVYAGSLGFGSEVVYPLGSYSRAYGFSVRCVRNRQ